MMTGDILLDLETMTPLVKDGDFVIGDASLQNQKLLLLAGKGEIKRYPTSGVGAFTFLDDESKDDFIREVRKEYVKDGMIVDSITLREGKIHVKANYPK